MTFYLVLMAALVLLAAITRPGDGVNGRRAYSILAFGLLAVVAAVRAPSVGADSMQYYTYYSIIGQLDWSDHEVLRYEPDYFLLNKALYLFSTDPQFFIAVGSVFVIAAVGFFCYKFSPSVPLSAVLFVSFQGYAMVLTALRQSIALAIVLLAVPRLLRHRYVSFCLVVLLATQFHSTAIVMLVLIPMTRARLNARAVGAYVALGGVLMLAAGQVTALVVGNASQYGFYLTNLPESDGKSGVALTLAFYFLLAVALSACLRRSEGKSLTANPVTTFFAHAAWALVPVLAFAYGSNAYLRLANYFVPFAAIAVPLALQQLRGRATKMLVSFAFCVAALAYFCVLTALRPEWYKVTPYQTVWF